VTASNRTSSKEKTRSNSFSERAHRLIPGGAHTYSRGDDQFPELAPQAFVRGKGARVWDVENAEYVDWGMGINNVLIGHAEDVIDDAAITAIRNGQAFSRPTPLEVDVAEAILELFPAMDMVKYGKNGSDANTSAVRLARAITGRDLIGYDESAPFLAIHDWFIGKTLVNAGVPKAIQDLCVGFRFNDIASVEQMFAENHGKMACVVMEVCRDVKPAPGFLETLRRLCTQNGTLLIFDEVVTGFRYALNGAHSLFGVTPDFLSIGKGMANGYAISAILGKREYMERGGLRHDKERVFFLSTTNGPEQSALAATLATIRFYQSHDVIKHIYGSGQAVMDSLSQAAKRHGIADYVSAEGDFACRPFPKFLGPDRHVSPSYRTLFLQEMAVRGVFMPWVCPSFRHGQSEIERTCEGFDAACKVYAQALEAGSVDGLLVGPAARPVFRRFN
jgi:glutamate-1-semialdehyde 2,1-aminomutase